MSKNPTIRDIAEALDLHFTTVGKALNNDPRISEATRKRVRKQAKKMDYSPNPLVSALMAHKKSTAQGKSLSVIAVLVESRTVFRFKAVERTRKSLEARAKELGFQIEYFPLDEYERNLGAICRVLRTRGIPSLLLMSVAADNIGDLDPLRDFCCVSVQEHYGALPSVLVDHFQSTELLCRRIHEAGYQRPGLLITPSLDRMGMDRVVAAFRSFSIELFGRTDAPILYENEADEAHLEAWLSEHCPDILIESWRGLRNPELRPTDPDVQRWLERFRPELLEGRRFSPERIRKILAPYPYVVLDRIEEDEAGISQNRRLAARKAVDVLTAALYRNERGLPPVGHRVMVEGSWAGALPKA